MDKEKIARINELAAIAKARDLTPEGAEERHALRQEYLDAVKKNMRATLESVLVENDEGEYVALKKRDKKSGHEHSCGCSCGHHHGHHHHHD